MTFVILAHTSGGSRFLNDPAMRARQDAGTGELARGIARIRGPWSGATGS